MIFQLWTTAFHLSWTSRRVDLFSHEHKKGKAIPVTGREDPQICETSRLPLLHNRLTVGSKFVSLMPRTSFNHRKISGINFCYGLEPRSILWLEGLSKFKKLNYLIWNRTRYLTARSIVLQTTMVSRVHVTKHGALKYTCTQRQNKKCYSEI
jgi:hypothetical protein